MIPSDYEIGLTGEFSKTIEACDVYGFAGITGDFNEIHVNAEAAKESIFGQRVVHGALVSSCINNAIVPIMPGAIAVDLYVKYIAPTFFGDTITAKAIVSEYIKDKFVKLDISISKQDGTEVITGYATVLPPKNK